MTARRPPAPRCGYLTCQLDRVLELLRTGRVDAARVELERITRLAWHEQPERCARTGSIPWPEPPWAA